jgi:hypothetical protein
VRPLFPLAASARLSSEIAPASPPLLASRKIASHRDRRDFFNSLLKHRAINATQTRRKTLIALIAQKVL